jgi:hypothetical protein
MRIAWTIVPLVLLVSVLAAGCGKTEGKTTAGPASASSSTMQPEVQSDLAEASDNQQAITVRVVFANATQPQPNGDLIFQIDVDNHSVDLSKLDLTQGTTLIVDGTKRITDGFRWAKKGAGHHVSGVLSLPNRDTDGGPLVTRATKEVVLEINGIGGVTRTFRFDNRTWAGF